MTDFRIKTLRCEWQVVVQQVDQYDQNVGQPTVLSAWPTYEAAYADLVNHGREHEFVINRWIPKTATNEFECLEVRYREVEI